MFWCAKSKNHIGFAQSGQLSELSYIFVFLTFLFTYTGIFTSYDAKFFNRQRPSAPFRASPHLQGRLQTIGRHRGWRSGKRRGTVKKYVRGRLCPPSVGQSAAQSVQLPIFFEQKPNFKLAAIHSASQEGGTLRMSYNLVLWPACSAPRVNLVAQISTLNVPRIT